MGVLFITHDFGVVAEIAHRVAVLREGGWSRSAPSSRCCSGRGTSTRGC